MKIALSLGSGSARGFAHMGVIDELQERGHEIVAVSGASMGALVGGVFAAGKLPEFQEWARGLTQSAVLRLLDPVLLGPGIIKADRVVGEVAKILGNVLIEDLAVPFTAVATDLTAKREIWFQDGPLAMAIRASIAIPSVITPVNFEGHILADGGITNPVPLEPLASVVADATVAVALSGKPISVAAATALTAAGEAGAELQAEDWAAKLRRSASGVLENDVLRRLSSRVLPKGKPVEHGAHDAEPGRSFGALPEDLSSVDVISMSLDVMGGNIERFRMAANPPDLLISIPSNVSGSYDFHRAGEIADVGRERAIAALDSAGL